jgi:hypothetical protein
LAASLERDMQSNIDTWLKLKSKTEERYLKNLDIINRDRLRFRHNLHGDIAIPIGYIFDTEGNFKRISAEKKPGSPKRSSRGSEDEQYMDDLIDHFQ